MRKSVPNQSLLLFIVSLIMLLPFTSINFSTVKAQEYGTFDLPELYSGEILPEFIMRSNVSLKHHQNINLKVIITFSNFKIIFLWH